MVRHIYPGKHSFLVLDDFINKLGETDFELMEVHNDRWSLPAVLEAAACGGHSVTRIPPLGAATILNATADRNRSTPAKGLGPSPTCLTADLQTGRVSAI
jgi:hypothetical protein